MNGELPEFAEEYGLRERVRLILTYSVIGGVFILAGKFWLLPAFSEFVATAPCRSVFGLPAVSVVLYGLLVGLPFLIALTVGCIFGWYGYRVLHDDQAPPTGVKVLRRTRIKRGRAARLVGYFYLFAFVPALALAGWGCFTARSLSQQSQQWQLKHPGCTANYSLKRTAVGRLR